MSISFRSTGSRLRLLAAFAVLAACGQGGSAEASPDGAFKTPTGNIVCGLNSDNVICVIKTGLNPMPPKQEKCDGGDPVSDRVILSATDAATPILCAGDPGPLVDEAVAKQLADGETIVQGKIGCATFKFGLVCTNSKGHGFFLSRAAASYF